MVTTVSAVFVFYDKVWPMKTTGRIIGILAMIAGATFVRLLLEMFSNPSSGMAISPWYGVVQYIIFFLCMAGGTGTILATIVREPIIKWIHVVSKWMPIVWIAPLIDLVVSNGQGLCMAYLGSRGMQLVPDFLTLGGRFGTCGITVGMRIEIIIILAGIAYVMYKKTRSVAKPILSAFLVYIFIFINGAIPGIFGLPRVGIIEFVRFVSSIHLIIFTLVAAYIGIKEFPHEAAMLVRSSRWERILYYWCIMALGIAYALRIYQVPFAPHDIPTVIVMTVSIACAGWAAAVWNDLNDGDIDTLSNTDRPLYQGMSRSAYANLGIAASVFSILASLVVGYGFFLMLLGTQAVYALYSYRGSSIKTHFLSSSVMIGLAGVTTALAGFLAFSPDLSLAHIPFSLIIIGTMTFGILSNAKDFKDVKGDRASGIRTLPALLGGRRAGMVILGALVVWIAILAYMFQNAWILLFVIPFIGLKFVTTRRTPEYVMFLIVCTELVISAILVAHS